MCADIARILTSFLLLQSKYIHSSNRIALDSVKSEPIKRIYNVIQMLNDSSGRKMNRLDGPVQTQTPSVQGIWTPFLDLSGKDFGVEIVQGGAGGSK